MLAPQRLLGRGGAAAEGCAASAASSADVAEDTAAMVCSSCQWSHLRGPGPGSMQFAGAGRKAPPGAHSISRITEILPTCRESEAIRWDVALDSPGDGGRQTSEALLPVFQAPSL